MRYVPPFSSNRYIGGSPPSIDLEELMLQGHVVLRFKTDAGTEDISESCALLRKSIDNRCARRGEWSLEHVAEDTENAVKVVELCITSLGAVGLPLHTSHHLGDENQIDDQWRG